MELRDKRIVVVGATGQVGTPVAKALAGVTGTPVSFNTTEQTIESVDVDTTAFQELLARAGSSPDFVDWREGLRRMVAPHDPQLLVG